MESHDPGQAAAEYGAMLRTRLDRAVTVATAVRLLGWLGRLAVVAVAALLAGAVLNDLLKPTGGAVGRWPVLAAAVAVTMAAWWRWAGTAPSRLAVARAIEAVHGDMGERVSRAVAFLDRPADAPREPSLTAGLRELAIEDAARAVGAIRRLPVPGVERHIPWAVAGSVAIVAWLAATQMVPAELVEDEPRQTLSAAAPAAREAVDQAEAALRLASVAAVESRLAEILLRRFAAAPGQTADSLSDTQQRDLAALAAVHEESLRSVLRIRAELAASERSAARAAAQQLEVREDASAAAVGHAIATNRLATAAADAQQWAESLTQVVRLLGGKEIDATVALSQLPPRDVVLVRRAEAALAASEARPLDGRQPPRFDGPAAVVARDAADQRSGPAGAERPTGPPGSEPTAAVTEAPTSEPRFVAGDSAVSRPLDEAATPQARVWSLLPTASRPPARSGAAADVPADYRAAVDLYYQLVLESLTRESTGTAAP